MAEAENDVVIGIDLGTTFSCVGAWIDGKVKILTDDEGRRTFPSYVHFTEGETLFGWEAKAKAVEDPQNTVFDAKRLIGRKFDEPEVQADMKTFGFECVPLGAENEIGIQVMQGGDLKIYQPEKISAMVLKHIKEIAEKQVGPVSRAVITVPAYFNDAQRSATKRAGKEAGLKVLRILNEPTAAAVAYGLNKRDEENILIFDLGGGTFDVSLLTIDDGIFEVKATSGDTHLGGEDFDVILVDHCINEFSKKCDFDSEIIKQDPTAMRALRTECEKCKCALSDSQNAVLEIGQFFGGVDLRIEISRQEFDAMLEDLYSKMKEPVESVLRATGMEKEKVNEIVLVGGSTRIPGVQDLLRNYFNGRSLCNAIDPDEAVAMGAAIQAAIIVEADPMFKQILLVDVLPLSLGIAVGGKQMDVLMPKNSPIPRSAKEIYTTYFDNQEVVRIEVYEGERVRVKDNHLLGAFELEVEKAPAGVPQVEVTFVINADGILKVTGQNINTGKRRQITVRNQNHNDEFILEAYEEEEMYHKEDEDTLLSFEAREGLREYTINIKNHADVSKEIKQQATKILDWIEQNEDCSHKLYEDEQRKLEDYVRDH